MNYNCELCNFNCVNKADIFRHCKTKKHLENFNPEQQTLLLKVMEYIDNDSIDGKDGIRINSAGGTGKTFVISSIMKYKTECIALGPTHQSVNMLLNQEFKAKTFHSYFGWSLDIDENNNEINIWIPPIITDKTIFVLDEISMMNKAQYSLFKHYIYGKFKYIMMGDKCQIPPWDNVKDDILPKDVPLIKNNISDLSLAFQFKCHEISLVKNMRTKNIVLNELLYNMRNSVLNNKEIFLENNYKLNYEFVKKNINRNYIFLAHEKKYVQKFNTEIRNYLFPNEIDSQLCVGDKITLSSFSKCLDLQNYKNNKIKFLQSGSRFTISYFTNTIIRVPINILENSEFIEFEAYEIHLDNQYQITTLKRDHDETFNKWYKDNCNLIKKIKSTKLLPLTDLEISNMKKKYYKLLRCKKDLNVKWTFSFASTINKAQGASYDLVFVFNHGTKYFRNKYKYTACSRVINELKIFS